MDSDDWGDDTASAPKMRELEVYAAVTENQLRETMVRIIRPALEKVGEVAFDLNTLSEKVARHQEVLDFAEQLREQVTRQGGMQDVLAESLAARAKQMEAFEATTAATLNDIRLQGTNREGRIQTVVTNLRAHDRDIARLGDELRRLEQRLDEVTRKLTDAMAADVKKAERDHDELLGFVNELQRLREELMEELFGEKKIVWELRNDIAGLNTAVSPLPEVEKKLAAAYADIYQLQERNQDCETHCDKVQVHIDELQASTANQFAAMRDEFRDSSNKMLASSMTFVKDIRSEYRYEMNSWQKMQHEISVVNSENQVFCKEISNRLDSESRRLDAVHNELLTDMDQLRERQHKDRKDVDAELQDTKRDRDRAKDSTQALCKSVEFLDRIVGLVLEGSRLTNAMALQDFADRSGETWLVLPTSAPRAAQATMTVEDLEKKRSQKVAAVEQPYRPHPIDWRQGLCQDGYRPGQIPFRGELYERQDLLLLHHKLLHKAQTARERGPVRANLESAAVDVSQAAPNIRGQPGANGASMGAQSPASTKAARTAKATSITKYTDGHSGHDVQSASQAESRSLGKGHQRPGSQGQPQAVGSRGGASGGLGEMELGFGEASKAHAIAPLRLPTLSADGNAEGRFLINTAGPASAATKTRIGLAGVDGSGGGNGNAQRLPIIGQSLTAR